MLGNMMSFKCVMKYTTMQCDTVQYSTMLHKIAQQTKIKPAEE